jgi:SAM-dependent methyltransferase
MHASTEKIASLLCCPDDRRSLRTTDQALECCHCGRVYPVRDGEILELLPSNPAGSLRNPEYAADYHFEFYRPFEAREGVIPWGLRDALSPSWRRHRERQVRAVLPMLSNDGVSFEDRILCDVSAGVGDYTLFYARRCKWVLHCDLSVDALYYALARSRRLGLQNVSFLRVDYFALPFRRSIDRLLCLDSLIRGEDHEKALLNQIARALSSEGRAIVDFHHWWHNPLRRLGLLRQNFGKNRSYTRSGAEALMRECGIRDERLVRFCQEFEAGSPFAKGLSWLLPATRLIYEFGYAASGPASPASAEAFSTASQPGRSAAPSTAKTSNA